MQHWKKSIFFTSFPYLLDCIRWDVGYQKCDKNNAHHFGQLLLLLLEAAWQPRRLHPLRQRPAHHANLQGKHVSQCIHKTHFHEYLDVNHDVGHDENGGWHRDANGQEELLEAEDLAFGAHDSAGLCLLV